MLLTVAQLKALAHKVYVTAVEQKGDTYTFAMYERAKVCPEKIPALLKEFRDDLAFKAEPPTFIYRKKRINKRDKTESALEVVKNVLIGIKGLLGN